MKNTQVTHHTGKGANQELLPNRHALNQISKGDIAQRSINNYSKATPDLTENGRDVTGANRTLSK